jgi:hypothetical protein
MNGYAIIAGRGSHLTDGALAAVMDGETDVADTALTHLSSCAECAERLDQLRIASSRFAAWLQPVAGAPPERAPRTPARRMVSYPAAAAAVFLVVASAAAATTPVREWIAQRLSGGVEPPATIPASSGRKIESPPAKGMVMSFSPAGSLLTLRFDERQARGEVQLVATTGDRVSAQIADRASGEELFVLPAELRIANLAQSTADYRISVPPSVRVIQLIIGKRDAVLVPVDSGSRLRIPLR